MLLGYIGAGQEFLEIPYRLNILARELIKASIQYYGGLRRQW
jgi:hypothetical protein